MFFKINARDAFLRRKYCRKGYHKLKVGSQSQTIGHRKTENIQYLMCVHCNFIFFASPRHKKKYLRMTAKERSAFRGFLSGLEAGTINTTGGDLWEEASASSSSDMDKE
jgi:hypothetical protein